jgi:GAF domain-containing protein
MQPRSYLGVPLQVRGKLIGAIELVNREAGGFTAGHLRVVETIAGQAAVSIQNALEVQARESQLKAQIQDLRIEIDEIKRSKQVEEIVDTDYFQRLSAQAKRLRADRGGAAES